MTSLSVAKRADASATTLHRALPAWVYNNSELNRLELERERDTMLLELLSTRAKGEKAAQMATAAGGGNQPRNK